MKFFNWILLFLLCASLFFSYLLYKSIPNVAFVDTSFIYNNFKMKQELEVKFKEVKEIQQKQLDSLYDFIDKNKPDQNSENFKQLSNQYLLMKQKFFEEQDRLKSAYDNQIWTQINAFVKEYGDEQKLDILFGANGQGSIMHGKNDRNISETVLDYANKKYNGK